MCWSIGELRAWHRAVGEYRLPEQLEVVVPRLVANIYRAVTDGPHRVMVLYQLKRNARGRGGGEGKGGVARRPDPIDGTQPGLGRH